MLTKIEDELHDLHDGDVLFPPNSNATGTLEVVPIHHNMHHKVQCDDDP